METRTRIGVSERGVALLIVLLITALLLALVFEFAYATRVSLRGAVNYRDAKRAAYLARSGVNFAGRLLGDHLKNGRAQDDLEQREWQIVPVVSEGDTELRVRWEDEAGRISIANVRTGQPSLDRLERLFGLRGIGIDALERIHELKDLRLPEELRQVLSDEEYDKVRDAVTVHSGTNNVDINTAPADVLQSMGMSPSLASLVIDRRRREPFRTNGDIAGFPGMDTALAAKLDPSSNVFRVHAHATVGEYTKQAEAVVRRDTGGGFAVLYWRML